MNVGNGNLETNYSLVSKLVVGNVMLVGDYVDDEGDASTYANGDCDDGNIGGRHLI